MIYIFTAVLFGILAVLSWIDLKTFRLPNNLTLPLILMGILQSWVLTGNIKASLLGAAIGYGVFVLIEIAFKKLRGVDGLGRGDAKLLAAGGAWCGWYGLPFIVLIASGMGLAALMFPSFRKLADEGRIPFGPCLALGIFMVWTAALIS